MKKIISFSIIALLAARTLLGVSAYADTTNLIANPSVESSTNSQPTNWTTNSWGTNTPSFSYVSPGHTGSYGVKVNVANYSSGDAKWMPDQVPVTAGQTYTYSDYSQASVGTELDAAYKNSSGAMSFVYLASIPASSAWQQTTTSLTVPQGAVSVSIYHIIAANGWLQTDDFSLMAQSQVAPAPTPTPTPAPTPTPVPTTGNLFTNPSAETPNAAGNGPLDWQQGSWGTNTPTWAYPSAGAHTGARSVAVTLSNYTSGDAKWYHDPVEVTAGGTYTYSDYYESNVMSRVLLVTTDATGAATYTELSPAAASTSWAPYTTTFVTPANAQTATIYHMIDRAGKMTLDDISLMAITDGSAVANFIPNPSFEVANGTLPADWTRQSWGTNTPKFTYVTGGAHTGNRSAMLSVSNYVSGDAKWAFTPLTNLTPGSQYRLSAWYKTNTRPHMVATYRDTNGVDQYLTLPNPLPGAGASTTWQQYTATLDIPTNAVSVTVFFLLSSNGWLQTDDYSLVPYTPVGFSQPLISLTFDDGWSSIYSNGLPLLQKYGLSSTQYLITDRLNTTNYMTTSMAQAFQTAGSEIGSHTVSHPDLTTLSASQLTTELSNSQTTLRQLFGSSVAQNFASPYGTYDTTTLAAIKQYYQSHRSTDVGYNSKDTFNPYDILVQDITLNVTPADVAGWVAKAKAQHTWLVLVYHEVSTTPDTPDYSVTPANLDQELAGIKNSGVQVVTVAQALAAIKSQL